MDVYFGKNKTCATADVTSTHATDMWQERWRDVDINCTWTIFLSPDLFENLTKMKINCCRTVRPYRKGMPQDLLPWNIRLKRGGILSRNRDDLTSMVWRDKTNVHILINMHCPATNDNFCDEHGNAVKSQVIQDYNKHVGYFDLRDRMYSYSTQCQTWKWTKNIIFCPPAHGTKMTHKDFRLSFMRNFHWKGWEPTLPTSTPGQSLCFTETSSMLEINFSSYWPYPSSRLCCWVCSAQGIKKKRKRVQVKCKNCAVGLCLSECFEAYHTKLKLWCFRGRMQFLVSQNI
jgi:hypothetical protein